MRSRSHRGPRTPRPLAWLQRLRSVLCFVAQLLWLALFGAPVVYLLVTPIVWLVPRWRVRLGSLFARTMAGGILTLFRAGGAKLAVSGRVPTDGPVLVVMNHQSLIDIPTAMRLSHPYSPGFVTRSRYRAVPVVAQAARLINGPFIDPRDPERALAEIRRAAAASTHGLLIFPEGHRSIDGKLRRFRTGGLQAILEAKRMPVYLIVTDGIWAARRLVDFILNVPQIQGRTEVFGPFDPPAADDEIASFVDSLQRRAAATLDAWRGTPQTGDVEPEAAAAHADDRSAGARAGSA
jgi:1-acyl-sn-glycerol-3-phosphate acyltransferase